MAHKRIEGVRAAGTGARAASWLDAPRFVAVLLAALLTAACQETVPPPVNPAALNQTQTLADSSTRAPTRPAAAASASAGDSAAAQPQAPRLYPGTGVFIRAEGTATRGGTEPGAGDITLNFIDADVREVVRSVLSDVLQLNFAIDPRVQATITVQTNRPLRRQDVLPVLEEVLRASGLALVERGGVYRLVPLDEAVRNSSIAAPPGEGPRALPSYNIQIIPLRYVSATGLQRTLEPFVPRGAALDADAARNLLIVAGTGQDLSAVAELVATFDADWLAGMSFGIFPLQTGAPSAIVSELNTIFSAGRGGALTGVRFVPLARINSILVISPQRANLERARTWIERLDRGNDETTARIYQYHVQNSRASDLAKVLTQLLSNGQARTADDGATQGTLAPAFAASGNTTRYGMGASPLALPLSGSAVGASVQNAPGPAAISGTGQVAAPTAPADTSTGPAAVRSDDDADAPKARIVADEKNNALVIFAKPRDYRMIEDALRKLDVVPLQVSIEATIAEVTLNHDLQYGLQWFFSKGANQATFSNSPTGAVAAVFPGFNYLLSTANAHVVLNALTAITDVNVISSPQLLVLDHHVAMLQVGDQVPIPVQQAQGTLAPGSPLVKPPTARGRNDIRNSPFFGRV